MSIKIPVVHGGDLISPYLDEDDAAEVLLRVNNYPALLAQNAELVSALREYDDRFTEFDPNNKQSRHNMRMAVIRAREQLAKNAALAPFAAAQEPTP